MDGVLKPAHAGPRLQLERALDAGGLVRLPFGDVRGLARRQQAHGASHPRQQLGRSLFPERAQDAQVVGDLETSSDASFVIDVEEGAADRLDARVAEHAVVASYALA